MKSSQGQQRQLYKFYIDRGGTFTDVYAEWWHAAKHHSRVLKLLSVDPANYNDAPKEAIRRVLYDNHGLESLADLDARFPASCDDYHIETIRMGTTVATNALLERKGKDFALLITAGFRDLLRIGTQNRPKIFDLNIVKPEEIYAEVVEVQERVLRDQVLAELDLDDLKSKLLEVMDRGIRNLAIVLMHSYQHPDHELAIKKLAYDMGFEDVSCSSEVMPMIKIVPRGDTTCIDAYISPIINDYIQGFKAGFSDDLASTDLLFMKSDAGLAREGDFRGFNSILSGPAGGVVACAAVYKDRPVIGFDMGGTSTDVSRYAGDYEISYQSEIAGLRVQSPQLDINTIAAGGGSRLFYDNGMFKVGPESSGAHPGPVCYKKGGYLSITDANLVLGRLIPEHFPKVFGPNADEALDKEASIKAFRELQQTINKDLESKGSKPMSIEEIAQGFIKVANEAMARPIREISMMRGYNIRDHVLVCFGGAGAQHACAIARDLGISQVLIHKYSGILSAYGLAQADEVVERQKPCGLVLNSENMDEIGKQFMSLLSLRGKAEAIPLQRNDVVINKYLNLRYQGTDTAFMVLEPADQDYNTAFIDRYRREFGFNLEARDIIVDDIRIREIIKSQPLIADKLTNSNQDTIIGPAVIPQDTATIVLEEGDQAHIDEHANVIIDINTRLGAQEKLQSQDPINLAIFSNRFMSIAEQMGRALERTAISTNIKERCDFSCAIFDNEANLVANAPHQPVHLGSMGAAVKKQLESIEFKPGDVVLTNHPAMGGSHLPDLTVITPVFYRGEIIFYVANRGHHADVGGISPGSMPSFSSSLDEEGIAIKSFKLVSEGKFNEGKLRELFSEARTIEDNISDLKAQIASNQKGIELINDLIDEYSLETVLSYMHYIQENAEEAVRHLIKDFAKRHSDALEASDYLDDGSEIKLQVKLDAQDGSVTFDFTGTTAELKTNLNTPPAVTSSAVLYSLRAMINREIPLNQGCLKPVEIILPGGILLNPSEDAPIAGGNTLTSQRIVDVIFKAFGVCAASQGCMNNITFGKGDFGYYETLAGGAGAGPGWHGASGVHTHMTNTRITDPEILETRYPVMLQEFALRQGSGGAGKYHGGDGVIREYEFLDDLNLSVLTERRNYAPYGLAGGKPGAKGENWLKRNGREENLGAKNETQVHKGDRLRVLTPGGGGYGHRN